MSYKRKTFVKLIVIGDSSVGKTSLIQRYVNKTFVSQYSATIGADFLSKEVLIDDKVCALQIWDTAGQEKFQSLGPAFYKGSEGCIIVYDITNSQSFENVKIWREEFLNHSSPKNPEKFPFLIIGNKVDKENERQVHFKRSK